MQPHCCVKDAGELTKMELDTSSENHAVEERRKNRRVEIVPPYSSDDEITPSNAQKGPNTFEEDSATTDDDGNPVSKTHDAELRETDMILDILSDTVDSFEDHLKKAEEKLSKEQDRLRDACKFILELQADLKKSREREHDLREELELAQRESRVVRKRLEEWEGKGKKTREEADGDDMPLQPADATAGSGLRMEASLA